MSNYQRQFFEELNMLLMDSWRVVPGTMFVAAVELLSEDSAPGRYKARPDGRFTKQVFSVVIERDDVR